MMKRINATTLESKCGMYRIVARQKPNTDGMEDHHYTYEVQGKVEGHWIRNQTVKTLGEATNAVKESKAALNIAENQALISFCNCK